VGTLVGAAVYLALWLATARGRQILAELVAEVTRSFNLPGMRPAAAARVVPETP
jgi:hypothetical protein